MADRYIHELPELAATPAQDDELIVSVTSEPNPNARTRRVKVRHLPSGGPGPTPVEATVETDDTLTGSGQPSSPLSVAFPFSQALLDTLNGKADTATVNNLFEMGLDFVDLMINNASILTTTLNSQRTSDRPLWIFFTADVAHTVGPNTTTYTHGTIAYIRPRSDVINVWLDLNAMIAALGYSHSSTGLADGSITTNLLADQAVTARKIAPESIRSSQFPGTSQDPSPTIQAKDIGRNQVTGEKIAANSINNGHMLDNAINTPELADNAVTRAKLSQAVRDDIDSGGGGGTAVQRVLVDVPASGDTVDKLILEDSQVYATEEVIVSESTPATVTFENIRFDLGYFSDESALDPNFYVVGRYYYNFARYTPRVVAYITGNSGRKHWVDGVASDLAPNITADVGHFPTDELARPSIQAVGNVYYNERSRTYRRATTVTPGRGAVTAENRLRQANAHDLARIDSELMAASRNALDLMAVPSPSSIDVNNFPTALEVTVTVEINKWVANTLRIQALGATSDSTFDPTLKTRTIRIPFTPQMQANARLVTTGANPTNRLPLDALILQDNVQLASTRFWLNVVDGAVGNLKAITSDLRVAATPSWVTASGTGVGIAISRTLVTDLSTLTFAPTATVPSAASHGDEIYYYVAIPTASNLSDWRLSLGGLAFFQGSSLEGGSAGTIGANTVYLQAFGVGDGSGGFQSGTAPGATITLQNHDTHTTAFSGALEGRALQQVQAQGGGGVVGSAIVAALNFPPGSESHIEVLDRNDPLSAAVMRFTNGEFARVLRVTATVTAEDRGATFGASGSTLTTVVTLPNFATSLDTFVLVDLPDSAELGVDRPMFWAYKARQMFVYSTNPPAQITNAEDIPRNRTLLCHFERVGQSDVGMHIVGGLDTSSGGGGSQRAFGSGSGEIAAWAEGDSTATLPDAKLPASIARDTEVAAIGDLRTRYNQSATPAAQDRLFFTDENQSGDPIRYVTWNNLASGVTGTLPTWVTDPSEDIPDSKLDVVLSSDSVIINDPDGTVVPDATNRNRLRYHNRQFYYNRATHYTDPTVTYRNLANTDLPAGYTVLGPGVYQVTPSLSGVANNAVWYSLPAGGWRRKITFGGMANVAFWTPNFNFRGLFEDESTADAHVQAVGEVVIFGGQARVVSGYTARTPDAFEWSPLQYQIDADELNAGDAAQKKAFRAAIGAAAVFVGTTLPAATAINDGDWVIFTTDVASGLVWRDFAGNALTSADAGDLGVFVGGRTWQRLGNMIQGPAKIRNQALTSAAAITWNVASGHTATLTLAANTTLRISGGADGDLAFLKVKQDGTGSRTLALHASILRFKDIAAPTLSTTANSVDLLMFVNDGGTWNYVGIR